MEIHDTLHLDAVTAQHQLRERLVGLARSESFVRSPAVSAACERLWRADGDAAGLLSEIWVESLFPAKSAGISLKAIANVAPSLLRQLERSAAFPVDRELYDHQAQTICHCQLKIPQFVSLEISPV